ncbi:MAG: DUF3048 domain-containing protein [Lachnospiraceae bacterium]|jgi:hypothetical protein|nr:DUF3048 domain-containing protein [Lachnospiraceae bacterium]
MRKCLHAKLLLAFLILCVLSGCSKKAVSEQVIATEPAIIIESETDPIIIETETEVEETEARLQILEPWDRQAKDGMVRSYLTGEMVPEDKGNRRPLAIMMSNDKASLPQYGINRAGIVYEAPVEGDMNRYMAIIEDYDDLERIGSVRSCRTYYTYFAREFDAIYAHFGQSTFAKPYLKNVDNINGIEGIGSMAYFRSRDKKSPHNAYASYTGIQNAVEKLGYAQEYDTAYQGHYYFSQGEIQSCLEGDGILNASKVTPGYPMNRPWFEYHEEDGLYYRYQYGAAHEGNEGPIAVKNILIQCCSAGYYATTDYRNINVHEDQWGGYFVTNGKASSISWKKDGEFGVTHYYMPDGQEIVLNPGKTWICIVPTSDADKIIFE